MATDTSLEVVEGGAISHADAPPDELMSRPEAMRTLGVSHTKIADMCQKGELRSWKRGRETFFDPAEVQALAGRDSAGSVMREAVALLKQSHAHNADAMRILLDGARMYGELSAKVVAHLLERNERLEKAVAEQRDLVAKSHAEETTQAIAMLKAEQEIEREKAIVRTAERAVPILFAKLSGTGAASDAAVAAAVRTIAGQAELVSRLRASLAADEQGQLDALLEAAREGAPK